MNRHGRQGGILGQVKATAPAFVKWAGVFRIGFPCRLCALIPRVQETAPLPLAPRGNRGYPTPAPSPIACWCRCPTDAGIGQSLVMQHHGVLYQGGEIR